MLSSFMRGRKFPAQYKSRFQVYRPELQRTAPPGFIKNTPAPASKPEVPSAPDASSAQARDALRNLPPEITSQPPSAAAAKNLAVPTKSGNTFYTKEKLTNAYYSSAIFGLIAGCTYSIASGQAGEEFDSIRKQYFPPEYQGSVSNVPREGAMVYHSFYPHTLSAKIDKALGLHKPSRSPRYVLLSGEAGIGKYSLILKLANDLTHASSSPASTVYSIDAWSQKSVNDGHRELARELGLKNDKASDKEVQQFIADQISRRDQTILIYRCARENADLPSDPLLNSSLYDFSKVIVFISTGSETVLNLARDRQIPVVNLTNSVSAQDLIDYYKNQNPNRVRLLEVMQPAGKTLVERLQGNPRLAAQAVAILENHPEMSLFELTKRIASAQPEAVLAQLALSLAQNESRNPGDLADVLHIISQHTLKEGCSWSALRTEFVEMNKLKPENSEVDVRLNQATMLLNNYDLVTYSAVQDKIYGRFLQDSQLPCFLKSEKG